MDSNEKTNKENAFLTKFLNLTLPFVIGGISGMVGTTVIQPIDMVKVRIQIKSEEVGKSQKVSTTSVIKDIYKTGGIKNFYKG
jgi:solute carrier family 25 oxoglutarate transporter 11